MNTTRTLIKSLNLTQKQLADDLGVHLRTVQRWCTRDKFPAWALRIICKLSVDKNNQ